MSIKKHRVIFWLGLLIGMNCLFASDNYVPSFPMLASYFKVNPTAIKLSMTIYFLAMSIAQLIYGPLSDRIGRKPILLTGLLIAGIGSTMCVLSTSIEFFLLGRFVQGLGMAAGWVLFRTVLRDVFSGNDFIKTSAIITTAISFMVPLAPIVGGYFQHYINWQANFWFMCVVAGALFLWILLKIPETLQRHTNKKPILIVDGLRELVHSPAFLSNVICSGLVMSILFLYSTMSPYLLQNTIGLNPVAYGWTSVITCSGLGMGGFVSSRLIGRRNLHEIIMCGCATMVVGSLYLVLSGMFGVVDCFNVLFGVTIIYFGVGLSLSNINSSAFLHFPHIAGLASAIFGSVQLMITVLVVSTASFVHVHNQAVMGMLLLACCTVVMFIKQLVRDEK